MHQFLATTFEIRNRNFIQSVVQEQRSFYFSVMSITFGVFSSVRENRFISC